MFANVASELQSSVRSFIERNGAADDAGFNAVALPLFAFQYDSVPIYRQFCASRSIRLDSVRDWTQIPALPITAFKEHAVSSLVELERTHFFQSSGTTSQTRSRHFHHAASLSIYEASLLPWFRQNVSPDPMRYLFLTPPLASAPHSSLVHMFETIRRELGEASSVYAGVADSDGSWNVDFAQTLAILREAVSGGRPLAILGTAFSFVHLIDNMTAEKVRLKLPAGSRVMETGGYKGRSRVVAKAELRQLMTRYLGVPASNIVTEYGMSELSSQAYSDGAGVFHFPPWVRAQVISPETDSIAAEGETGLLRIFDVANIYSVMAIQCEDLAIRRGTGFELIGRAEAAEPRGCSLQAAT